jgi:hypothetical protein
MVIYYGFAFYLPGACFFTLICRYIGIGYGG